MENRQAGSIMKLAKESDVDYSVTEGNIMHTVQKETAILGRVINHMLFGTVLY